MGFTLKVIGIWVAVYITASVGFRIFASMIGLRVELFETLASTVAWAAILFGSLALANRATTSYILSKAENDKEKKDS